VELQTLLSPLPIGILLGLFIGKPLGIFSFSYLAVKGGFAKLPGGVTFRAIFAVSVLCGIGFTMSMFIASLAFEFGGMEYGTLSRLGILCGSTLAAGCGYSVLRRTLRQPACDYSPVVSTIKN
jgi:NhaA family Na+:H+ antiporter